MILRRIPPLDDQITAIVRNGIAFAIPAQQTTECIIRAIEEEQQRDCTDGDCIIRRPHSRLGPHLGKHEASPPFDHVRFTRLRLCFSCGRRRGHRIHRDPE